MAISKSFPDPISSGTPPPVEKEGNGTLTMEQLDNLRDQFLDIAPKGRKSDYCEKRKKKKSLRLTRKAITCPQVRQPSGVVWC